jgi:uncharacterized protein (TIGR02246 family)
LRKISAPESTKIEAAIRKVFEAGCAAWNLGDLDGYLAGYWDSDQTLYISNGTPIRGKEAIVAAYKTRFSIPDSMGNLTVSELEIEVLTTADAIAFGRWRLSLDNGSPEGFFTVQLKKIEDTWLFVSDHSSSSV